MNFSKLNPKNGFKKPEPFRADDFPFPTASGRPKYRPGQRCLIVGCTTNPSLIGSETYLIRVFPRYIHSFTNEPIGEWAWETDLSYDFTDSLGKWQLVFIEPHLLPIDDEEVNEKLRQEMVDESNAFKVDLQRELDKLDKAIEELDKQVKREKAI